MDGKVFVIAIVAIVMFTGIITTWLKRGRDKSEDFNFDKLMQDLGLSDVDELGQYKKKIANLEERVQVLEKLATDRKHTLADEIDRL